MAAPSHAAPRDDAKAIRTASRQLAGVFAAQMLAAMRDTIPTDGFVQAGSGEEMFRSMLDEKVAERIPATEKNSHGLAHSIERSLSAKLARQASTHAPTP
jgi:Rod binding domain-containing protein